MCAWVSVTKGAAEGSLVPIIDIRRVVSSFLCHPERLTKYLLDMEWVSVFIFPHNSCIEVYFTYHSINPFKECNSVVFSISTELCNLYQNQF